MSMNFDGSTINLYSAVPKALSICVKKLHVWYSHIELNIKLAMEVHLTKK